MGVYDEYTCREMLIEMTEQLIRQIETDGIKKVTDPIYSILKDPDYDNYPYVRLDGSAYALYVMSNSLALENGGNLQLLRAQMDSLNWDPVDTTYLLTKTKLEESGLVIGGIELVDGAADIRASVAADGAQNALFVQSNTLLKKTEFEAVTGTAVASPTANTLADRLKSINDSVVLIKDTDGIKKITDALPAGENHLGEVGGNSTIISPSITVDTAAYTTGDVVGGKLTFTGAMRISGGNGSVGNVVIVDAAQQKAEFDLILFDSDPTAGTYTDGSAPVFSTDVSKIIGKVKIETTDYEDIGGISIADVDQICRIVKASGSANLYGVLIVTGTPDYVNATDLTLRVGFDRN